MKILIAGCGYVGSALGRSLSQKGHEVFGVRRQWSENGLNEPFQKIAADLHDPASLSALPKADAVVFCQAPKHKVENYRDTYFQGTMNLLRTFDQTAPQRIIFISSTSVYGVTDGSWVDELTEPGGNFETQEDAQNAQWLLNAENLVLASGIPGIIFRLGGIYGPGRHRLRLIKEGKMKPSFTDLYTNRIHRDDIVGGLELLLEKGKAGEVYLGVDDDPATQDTFYSWLYEKLHLPKPPVVESAKLTAHGSNKRCSNRKIKALGLQLKYPTFREGYAELLNEVS